MVPLHLWGEAKFCSFIQKGVLAGIPAVMEHSRAVRRLPCTETPMSLKNLRHQCAETYVASSASLAGIFLLYESHHQQRDVTIPEQIGLNGNRLVEPDMGKVPSSTTPPS
jgi:hypothetical protein